MNENDKATVNITITKISIDLLERNIAHLATLMRNNEYKIDKVQYVLPKQQITAMEEYLMILDLRIKLYNERNKSK